MTTNGTDSARPSLPAPGQVVWLQVFNPLENPNATGKWRPGILVRREAGHWLIIGLTTSGRYRNGRARTAIPQPLTIGLSRPGFIWGHRLTRVSAIDIGDHVGWIDPPTAEALITVVNLDGRDADVLRQAESSATRKPPPPERSSPTTPLTRFHTERRARTPTSNHGVEVTDDDAEWHLSGWRARRGARHADLDDRCGST